MIRVKNDDSSVRQDGEGAGTCDKGAFYLILPSCDLFTNLVTAF